ncbi:MAG: ankyrin repeat domain-containing protein [Planctomycetota bacterium]
MLQRIRDGRTDLVIDYIEAGHPATAEDEHGTSLLAWCAYHGDVTAVRFLLAQGAPLRGLGTNLDLLGACFHGHWQLCEFLLEQGADPNHADEETGETPLHAATSKANRPRFDRVVEALLARGADPNRKSKAGVETGSFMRDCRTRGETPLHRAAAFGTEHAVELLLNAGADRESKDAHGDTPLGWASWHLRPAAILRRLCYGRFTIHSDNRSTYDHGAGWGSPPHG